MARSRGQSETIGVILLTAVIVILVVLVSIFLLANAESESEREPKVSTESTVTADSLELRHQGGDSFDPEMITVIVRDENGERRYSLADDFTEADGDGDTFGPGQRWRRDLLESDELLTGSVRLLVLDEESGALLYESAAEVGTEGLVLTLDSEQITTDGSTNYTVTRLFEQKTSRTVTGEATVSAANTTVAEADEGRSRVVGNSTGTTTITAVLPDENLTASASVEVVEPGSLTVTDIEHDNPVTVGDTFIVTAPLAFFETTIDGTNEPVIE